jgi:hypothetical protein
MRNCKLNLCHGQQISDFVLDLFAIFEDFSNLPNIAGYRITPVSVFWTLHDLYWEFLRLWTGFGLSSSWVNLPGYGPNRNRNILDFMK